METRAEYNFELRTGSFGPGFLRSMETRTLAPPSSTVCTVPSDVKAYVLNVTLIPKTVVDFLTLWPAGEARPEVWSARSPDGQIVANSAIVRAGAGGAISVFSSDDADVLIDIAGYFTDNAAIIGMTYHPMVPCRVIETRAEYRPSAGPFGTAVLKRRRDEEVSFPGDTILPNAGRSWSLCDHADSSATTASSLPYGVAGGDNSTERVEH